MLKNVRLWPVILIIAIDIAAAVWLNFQWALHRQNFTLALIFVQLCAAFLLVLWLLFFSRLAWKTRLLSFGGILLLAASLYYLFPFRAFTGNLVPTFEWRWTRATPSALDIHNSRLTEISRTSKVSYAQFLGPNRNAMLPGTKLNRDWKTNPPKELWRRNIGAGWSSFAVSEPYAITQEQRGANEMEVCYNLYTGEPLWLHKDAACYEPAMPGIGEGPRATPTIVGDRVYTYGATGILNCLTLKSGKSIWQHNVIKENNSMVLQWGGSCSPLVLDSMVVVSSGARNGPALIAYQKDTGKFLWGEGEACPGYTSPSYVTLCDLPQILIMNRRLVSHAPTTGKILWDFPWPGGTERIAQPVLLSGNRVLLSTGYGVGSKMLQISKREDGSMVPELLWESIRMKAKFTNLVHKDGYVYGFDDGILACMDLADGSRKWKRGRYGHGQIILAGETILVLSEKGEVALVDADPEEFRELARFDAISGKTWSNPALAGSYLLVRNAEEAACFQLSML